MMHPAFGAGRGPLRWAHAANSERQLRAALEDELVDAVEADVSTLPTDPGCSRAYMLHPPAVEADITAERFLDIVRHSGTRKIVKLDLKCDDVIEEVVDLILRYRLTDVTPLVMNADVVGSPGSPSAVAATSLLSQHARLQNGRVPPVVSLGWCPPSGDARSLTLRELSEMAALARGRPATLAVRADVALASEEALVSLLTDLPGCGLTLWAHDGDPVCPEALWAMVKRIGPASVWVDVPRMMLSRFPSVTSQSVERH